MPIVEGTMVAVAAKDAKGNLDRRLSRRLELAMAASIQVSHELGITDPVIIKERMMAAYKADRGRAE